MSHNLRLAVFNKNDGAPLNLNYVSAGLVSTIAAMEVSYNNANLLFIVTREGSDQTTGT